MPRTVQDTITRASDIVQDATNVRWPFPEMLRWLNDGRLEIAIARPDIYAVTTSLALAAGTKQSLPADGARFLDAVRNLGAANEPGRAVRIVEREILDAQLPDWHIGTPASAVKHFMFDERAPTVFYVYPPVAAGTKLEIVYSRTPIDKTAGTDELVEEGMYAGALVDYLCYRMFLKDATYAGNLQRAAASRQAFDATLGVGARASAITSPNTANVGGMPPRTAVAAGG